mmetsp:Transcript_29708/g.85032  ORF Transcript_29708/g.85032 Transcript_29708/m.85032 type:complete len:344 (+) Transcript_29708:640-1671(+)
MYSTMEDKILRSCNVSFLARRTTCVTRGTQGTLGLNWAGGPPGFCPTHRRQPAWSNCKDCSAEYFGKAPCVSEALSNPVMSAVSSRTASSSSLLRLNDASAWIADGSPSRTKEGLARASSTASAHAFHNEALLSAKDCIHASPSSASLGGALCSLSTRSNSSAAASWLCPRRARPARRLKASRMSRPDTAAGEDNSAACASARATTGMLESGTAASPGTVCRLQRSKSRAKEPLPSAPDSSARRPWASKRPASSGSLHRIAWRLPSTEGMPSRRFGNCLWSWGKRCPSHASGRRRSAAQLRSKRTNRLGDASVITSSSRPVKPCRSCWFEKVNSANVASTVSI